MWLRRRSAYEKITAGITLISAVMVSVIDVQLHLVIYLTIMVFDLVDQMVD